MTRNTVMPTSVRNWPPAMSSTPIRRVSAMEGRKNLSIWPQVVNPIQSRNTIPKDSAARAAVQAGRICPWGVKASRSEASCFFSPVASCSSGSGRVLGYATVESMVIFLSNMISTLLYSKFTAYGAENKK